MPTLNPHLRSEFGLDFLGPRDTVDDALNFLGGVWRQRPDIAPHDRMVLETIVGELISNVIRHNPGQPVSGRLSLQIEPDRIQITTDDDGRDAGAALNLPTEPDPLAETGRGIMLIKRLADTVTYTRNGSHNRWRISCRLQPIEPDPL